MGRYNYKRRPTTEVLVGRGADAVGIGGMNAIRIQSMTNTSTLDTDGSARQVQRIAEAGGEIVRLTTQGVREAANLSAIKASMASAGCKVPLVADIHFNPNAAYEAAVRCEKVRINPGNFVDAPRQFKHLEYTEEEYRAELDHIRKSLVPFLDICKEYGTSVRLGVNHGSLSDRIMSRYGNTPAGMVESAMEFLRVCREEDFSRIVISIKASNTVVMVDTVRLLVSEMDREGMCFPIHLGVTEAGDGEDGRIKSAVGIGTLLSEGIGDTVRVSLSEPPENEIPVARLLCDYITSRAGHKPIPEPSSTPENTRSMAVPMAGKMWEGEVGIAHLDFNIDDTWHRVDAGDEVVVFDDEEPIVITSSHRNRVGEIESYIDRAVLSGVRNPFIISLDYDTDNLETLQVEAGADFGTLLLNGYGAGIELKCQVFSESELTNISEGILQAARLRFSRPEYIACPGCGRTLFDLQSTLREVKAATKDLKGLKIGVMGCIVNGPGEMADADYGYVGAGPGRVSLYRGKEMVVKNIPTEEALPLLLEMIKSDREEIWADKE